MIDQSKSGESYDPEPQSDWTDKISSNDIFKARYKMVNSATPDPRFALVYLVETDEKSGTPPINRKNVSKNFEIRFSDTLFFVLMFSSILEFITKNTI